MDDLKKTTRLAVVCSLLVVGALLLFGDNGARQPTAVDRLLLLIVRFVTVLSMTCTTIYFWMQCAKKYIDHAIDRRLGTSGSETQQS